MFIHKNHTKYYSVLEYDIEQNFITFLLQVYLSQLSHTTVRRNCIEYVSKNEEIYNTVRFLLISYSLNNALTLLSHVKSYRCAFTIMFFISANYVPFKRLYRQIKQF